MRVVQLLGACVVQGKTTQVPRSMLFTADGWLWAMRSVEHGNAV